ncbi:hypothetical protein NM208_g8539 [Fusarium decemcellulare]|uniref:Uncharacterized protein n=1 Tax=Fusarium decemcellulare TaxID=57161 RepID=A0ACC1S528_9HYPO|nr:hypothetical protein NM208_g8539 [Fusarium decemcellulare]
MPRPGQTSVPLEDVRRTLESLDRQHIDATTRLRRDARPQQVVESERQNLKRRMPLGEVTRTLEDLERRHIQDTVHRRQGAPLRANPEPQNQNKKHWIALEEIFCVSDDLDRRRAGTCVRLSKFLPGLFTVERVSLVQAHDVPLSVATNRQY